MKELTEILFVIAILLFVAVLVCLYHVCKRLRRLREATARLNHEINELNGNIEKRIIVTTSFLKEKEEWKD